MINSPARTASERLDALSACAYRLGERFGAEAERGYEPGRVLTVWTGLIPDTG